VHKIFISYHHKSDQCYKDRLIAANDNLERSVFVDASVDTGDVSDRLGDEAIREKIRDEYLRDSTVTVLLVGTETKHRKHVDWEIYSSMYDGAMNKKSGILVVNLPSVNCDFFTAPHDGEKQTVYPDIDSWISIKSRAEYERRYPYLPDRIIDNLLKPEAKVSVVPWYKIEKKFGRVMGFLVDAAFQDRDKCEYDLSRPLKRSNS